MNYWAMRTCRDNEMARQFLLAELHAGRLRQGWGYDESQDLRILQANWQNGIPLTDIQQAAALHWRMANGPEGEYMQVDDLVVVPNSPIDGLFTICRITDDYEFDIATDFEDFGHIRPVEVIGPAGGVANNHELVDAALRRSFRCPLRMWNVTPHQECLNFIVEAELPQESFAQGVEAGARVEAVVAELITEPLNLMAERLGVTLPATVRAEEWEPVMRTALESLFPVSVHHTGGPHERGADIDIVIPNPFVEGREWIVPVQVKDYKGEVDARVADQLEIAFDARSESNQVIAVVLLVSNAMASDNLKERMDALSRKHRVPFIFCGHDIFMRLLARGYLRRS